MITQAEAAKILGINRAAIAKWKKEIPLPEFFVENEKGVLGIDETHPGFKARVAEKESNKEERLLNNKKVSEAKKKNMQNDMSEQKNGTYDNIDELRDEAHEANLNKAIFSTQIAEEKAKQEKLKTEQIRKSLAPTSLIKYFFSFTDGMIQRFYDRPFEIWPQIKSLAINNEDDKGVDLIRREIEGCVKDAIMQLKEEIKKEGLGEIIEP